MFISFSNHPSSQWSPEQTTEAQKYGDIIDMPFPAVPADADSSEIENIGNKIITRVLDMNPDAVMCQGEFTLAFYIITKLMSHGITVLAACTQREAEETVKNDVVSKTSVFRFVRFREYTY